MSEHDCRTVQQSSQDIVCTTGMAFDGADVMKKKRVCQAWHSKPRKTEEVQLLNRENSNYEIIIKSFHLSLFSASTLLISYRCPWRVLEKFFLEILKGIPFLDFLTYRGLLYFLVYDPFLVTLLFPFLW